MSKIGGIIVVVLSLVAGFVGGWSYQFIQPKTTTSTSTSSTPTTAASVNPSASATSSQSLADCLKSVWGADKYAAIQANASLATTDDNLAALKCYKS